MATAVTYFPYTITPTANIGPATYTDGTTLLRELEELRQWLNTVLVDQVNANQEDLLAQFQAGIANAEQAYTEFINNSATELAGLNDTSMSTLINTPTSATATAFQTFVQNLAVLPAQLDALVAAKVTDGAAQVRAALDGIYAHATALADLVPLTQRGAANGVATLDAGSKVPVAQVPAVGGSGTFANRPAVATVPAGFTYYATDAGTAYQAQAGTWALVGKGGYLGKAKLGADYSTSATELQDVPGLAVTFVAGTGPVKVTLSGEANNTVNGGKVVGAVYVGATDIGHINVNIVTANDGRDFTRVYTADTLTPGEVYTVRVRIMAHYATGGFAKLSGTVENPTQLIVEAL